MLTRQMAISREGWPTASAEAFGEGWKAGVGSKRLILSQEFKKSPIDSAEDPFLRRYANPVGFNKPIHSRCTFE